MSSTLDSETHDDRFDDQVNGQPFVLNRRRQRALARAQRRATRSSRPSGRRVFIAGCVATTAVAGGVIVNGISNAIPNLPKVEPNPGQELGNTNFSDAEVDAFRISSVDAIGEAELTVQEITQQLIDKREAGETDTPHETLVFSNGVFGLRWENPGAWAPTRTKDGLEIELAPVVANDEVEVIKPPKLNEEKSSRAFWQGAAGFFGASDTQAQDFSEPINDLATEIGRDPDVVGDHMYATACGAIASASSKAKTISDGLGIESDIETYVEPRSPNPRDDEAIGAEEGTVGLTGAGSSSGASQRAANGTQLRKIRFTIENPLKPGEQLALEDCLKTLDGLAFSPTRLATPEKPNFGLLPISIGRRRLDPISQ